MLLASSAASCASVSLKADLAAVSKRASPMRTAGSVLVKSYPLRPDRHYHWVARAARTSVVAANITRPIIAARGRAGTGSRQLIFKTWLACVATSDTTDTSVLSLEHAN
eukprot:649808-Pleurochrysis_carterae.AAC.1